MIKLNENQVTFKIETDEDPSDIDSAFDGEGCAAWVHEQMNAGNIYAWFCAKVTASLKVGADFQEEVSEFDCMGACSYESEKAWLESDELKDMKSNALEALNNKLNDMHASLRQFALDQERENFYSYAKRG